MALETFEQVWQRAAERKGGDAKLKAMLSKPAPSSHLAALGDDRYLAEFSKKVFQSGFVWRVVEQKWDDFERVFFGFDIEKVCLMPDEMLEKKASDPSIIRNFTKVKTIRANANMIADIAREHGSFAQFIADWPSDNIIGLWELLKKKGSRLGGNTGAYALRALGKDTFLLSNDVVAYFKARDLVTGSTTSKRSLQVFQDGFNQLQQQSGLTYQELSRLLAFSVGDNYVV